MSLTIRPARLPNRRPLIVAATRTVRACGALTAFCMLSLGACKSKPAATEPTDVETGRSTIVAVTTTGYVEARTSQIVTNGAPPSTAFDDFRVSSTFTIRTVSWQGIYCRQQANAAAPSPTATAFTVRIYADVGGRPNMASPLYQETVPLSRAAQTFDKNVSGLTCGTAANTTWPFYRYSTTLGTPFTVTPGRTYWLSVQATTPSYDVYWGWRDGTPDNGVSLTYFDGTWASYPVDRAYALEP